MEVPKRYLERIRSVYPNLEIKTLDYNQDGLVNEAVVVNGELVCRFVREEWGQELLAAEAKILDLVRPRVGLPVPEFEHLEADFCAYRYLPGEPTTRNVVLRMSEGERARILAELGGFIRQMHAVPVDQAVDIPPSDAVRGRDDWLRFFRQVREHLYPHLYRHQRLWAEELFAPVESGELSLDHSPALIHADLAVYHVLHDPQTRRLTGVLDFGTAGLGDPATDIAVFIAQYGESLTLKMGYAGVEDLLPRARLWAGTMELQWALAGVKNGHKGLAVAHIGGARDVGV